MPSYFLKYKTNEENNLAYFSSGTLVDGDRMRVKVKFSDSGTIQMTLINLDTNETNVTYLNESASGLDLTPVKVIIGADHQNDNHLEGLKVERIAVK